MTDSASPLRRLRRLANRALLAYGRRQEVLQTSIRKRDADRQYTLPPSGDRPIVLDVYVPQNLMHLAPLYHALKKRRLPVFVALRDALNETRDRAIARGIEAADVLMGDGLLRIKPALTVASDQAFDWLHSPIPDLPRVQIFHGCLLKSFSNVMGELTKFSHFFFPGPLYRNTFESHVVCPVDRAIKYHDTGMPRTDDILAMRSNREAACNALGINAARKVVLYAPTWHVEATFFESGVDIVRTISAMGLQCLVRPHPFTLNTTLTGLASRRAQAVLDTCRGLPGVILAHDMDDRLVMAASDLLVADFGSIAYEYLILNRPVVFFDSPAYHRLLKEEDLEWWGRSAGSIVNDAGELQEAIFESLRAPETMADQRKEVLDKTYFNLGRASEVCCDALESIRG